MTGYPGDQQPPHQPTEPYQQTPYQQTPYPPPPPGYNPYGPYPYGPPPAGYGQVPAGPPPTAPRNGLGITALVLGIVGLLAFWSVVGGILFGVAAVIVGLIARGRVRRGEATNGGVAIAGIALGALAIVVSAAFIAVWANVFSEVGFTDYADCVSQAGNDQRSLDRCIEQFTERVDDRFSTVAPTPTR